MGCSFSQERNHQNPRIFKVYNVDSQGQERSAGRIEITDTDLVLYQKGKDNTQWPLRSLRRYGFDAELFSFESGRRCQTGPGVYAFKCQRAEALFNLLQQCIQRAGQEEPRQTSNVLFDRPMSIVDIPGPEPRSNGRHPYMNGSVPVENGWANGTGQATALPQNHQYVNTAIIPTANAGEQNGLDTYGVSCQVPDSPVNEVTLNYAELDLPASSDEPNEAVAQPRNGACAAPVQDPESTQGMYVNVPVDPSKSPASGKARRAGLPQPDSKDDPHNYANLGLLSESARVPLEDPFAPKLSYAHLDLESNSDPVVGAAAPTMTSTNSVASNLESPDTQTQSYAMIDFHKTAALNTRTAPSEDEGIRKTRHNSNIEDVN